jgi:DNA (cytosine-5)-methyltransferase 1
MQKKTNRSPRYKISVIDLFAGAGGFAVASEMAGGQVKLSVELDTNCCYTLEANEQWHAKVEQADVRELGGRDLRRLAGVPRDVPLVIVGGPPCQPFSKASYWTDPGHDSAYRRARAKGEEAIRPKPITRAKRDERRDLLNEFLRLVVEAKADGFVMENVTSLLHPRNRRSFNRLVGSFEENGYACTVVTGEGTNYGVPQKRSRVFILGSLEEKPVAPLPTHRASPKDPPHLPAAPGVGPYIAPFSGSEYYEDGEEVNGRWAECLRQIPPGWNYKHLTAWAGHPAPVFEAETRFWNFLLKLRPDAPSWTINANPGPWVGPFHWENRRLRTPELAAIQTFPGGYKFHGSRRERVRQLGNAVPPLLAKPMVKSVLSTIRR